MAPKKLRQKKSIKRGPIVKDRSTSLWPKVIIWIVSVIGCFGVISAYQVYKSAPDVSPPVAYDRTQPFVVPFTVSNNSFVNFYDVAPACSFAMYDRRHDVEFAYNSVKVDKPWKALEPKQVQDFDCVLGGFKNVRVDSLQVDLELSFDLRVVPSWRWHKKMTFPFHVVATTVGDYWVPGALKHEGTLITASP